MSDSNHIRSRNTAVANPENTAPEYLPAPVRCEYIPSSQLADRLHHAHSHVLAVISYGTDIRAEVNLPCPVVTVDTVQFGNVSQTEIWTSPTPVYSARNNCIQFSANGEVLFGYIRLPEPKGWSLDATSHGAYRRILDLIQNEGYPHLMRVWNYLRDINQFANELERYQLFCLGRHRAFSDSNSFFERDLPAASAIGTRYGDSLIYFLAAKQAGMQIENPRQISAFHYPPCYGPRSPSFSRALLKEWRDEHHLYIAGTASIVGHESCHIDDWQGQIDEIMQNINTLIRHAGRTGGIRLESVNDLSLMKIYIRHPQYFGKIKDSIDRYMDRHVQSLYVQGDICRNELLLEIEGICHVEKN